MSTSSPSAVLVAPTPDLPEWAKRAVNVADPRIGAAVHSCSDDFFAPAIRMLQTTPAIFVPGKYDDNGKWMDGWESRRRRHGGHDWCIVALARPARLYGVDIDTSFFTGNYPPAASLDGCLVNHDPLLSTSWRPLLGNTALAGNRHHFLELSSVAGLVFSHVRLNIFPDGGIARLRIYGRIEPPALPDIVETIDLAAMLNGARPAAWNDAHFGSVSNMLQPGRGIDMGDGWETRRRREPGYDWCIVALAMRGNIERIGIDTAHFKGNYPDKISVQAATLTDIDEAAIAGSENWQTLLPPQALSPDCEHEFHVVPGVGPVTHVRLNLFPDGGVSRLRLWGKPTLTS